MGRSVTRTDFRHRLVFSGVYDLPFGKGRQFLYGMSRVPELLLGGWQIHGIDVLQSGSLQGSGAAHTAGIFTQAIRANTNGQSPVPSTNARDRLDRWFNTSVFSQPAPFTLGNAGTLALNGCAQHGNNLDFPLLKQFSLTGKFRLQFRAESFNFADRVQFSGAAGN